MTCSAASKGIPKVEGGSLGVDPYVKEFQTAMEQANAELASIRAAILAVPIPQGTKAGALAAGAKSAGEYAAVGAVVLRAEKAHAKFLAHIMGFKPSDDIDIKLNLRAPIFEDKKDANLRPKADPTLKGALRPGPAGSEQKLTSLSSRFSYSTSVGPVGSGFAAEGSAAAHQTSAIGNFANPAPSAPGPAGVGAVAVAEAAGISKTVSDAPPAGGPGAQALSSNTSTVVQGALERAQERQRAAEQAAQEREQKKEQRQQQMAQMAQQMLGQAGQALGKAQEGAGECKNCNQKKQQESQQAAAAAPV